MGRTGLIALVLVTALTACTSEAGPPSGKSIPHVVPSALPSDPWHLIGTASPSPTPSPEPTPEPEPPPEPRSATVNVSGDLLWHNTLWETAKRDARAAGTHGFDFFPQLASLQEYVSAADLAICHAEVPLAPKEGPYRNYPLFAAPQEVVPAIKEVGWDLCTTASNHTMDQGWDGLVRTLSVFQEHGILTVGSFASQEAAETPVIFTTEGGVRIAVISQTYGLNGLPKAKDKPWSVELLNADLALAQARRAKEAGADLVLVHFHAGDEYSSRINVEQRAYAEAVTASPDVDLVFGQHAHVAQPIDRINDIWVIYGMGNLIAASGPPKPLTYEGYMAQVTFVEQPDGSFAATAAEFAPTMIGKKHGTRSDRVYLIPDELRRGTEGAPAREKSAARTRATVRSLGVEGLTERE